VSESARRASCTEANQHVHGRRVKADVVLNYLMFICEQLACWKYRSDLRRVRRTRKPVLLHTPCKLCLQNWLLFPGFYYLSYAFGNHSLRISNLLERGCSAFTFSADQTAGKPSICSKLTYRSISKRGPHRVLSPFWCSNTRTFDEAVSLIGWSHRDYCKICMLPALGSSPPIGRICTSLQMGTTGTHPKTFPCLANHLPHPTSVTSPGIFNGVISAWKFGPYWKNDDELFRDVATGY
jgi:hypothetical protein